MTNQNCVSTPGRCRYLSVAILCAAATFIAPRVRAEDMKIVGYYPSWTHGTFPHTSIRYDILTHIAHAFVFPYADGTLDVSTFSLYPQLNQTAHQNGVQVVLAVGGWDAVRTPRYSQMAADSASRARFAANLVAFCLTNDYDGVDLDWEYPKTATDRSNLTLLVKQLRSAFDAQTPRLTLSMAAPAGWWGGQWIDIGSIQSDLDWIGMMTYDFYGAWTPKAGPNSALYAEPSNTEGWVENSVSYWGGTRGVPGNKLLVGVPFYGQQFTATALWGVSSAAVQVTYRNIAPNLSQGWTRFWNQTGRYPYMVNPLQTLVITYDDSASVAEKASFVRSNGCGGVIIWAIGQDEIGGSQPLLESLAQVFGLTTNTDDVGSGTVPRDFNLDQNFPNPFNGETHIRFRLGKAAVIDLRVFDLLGRDLLTLASGEYGPGEYDAVLSSQGLSAGAYVYRLTSSVGRMSKRFIVAP